jgi:transposase
LNILGWPEWKVLDDEPTVTAAGVLQIRCKPPPIPPPTTCPACGVIGVSWYKHGERPATFKDSPIRGQVTELVVLRQRWRCRDCQATTTPTPPELDESAAATKRLLDHATRQGFAKTFALVARETGLDDATVLRLVHARADWLDENVRFETPRVLGIDDVRLLGRRRTVLLNIEQRTVIGLLEDDRSAFLWRYLRTRMAKAPPDVVTMDFAPDYAKVTRDAFPKAVIVVDKFHVFNQLNNAFAVIRIKKGKTLTKEQRSALRQDQRIFTKREAKLTETNIIRMQTWTGLYPELRHAYDAKEAFYCIYDLTSRQEAETAYLDWLARLTPQQRKVFAKFIRLMKRRGGDVFNYFDHPYTNAATEQKNSVARYIYRQGGGYSWNVLRAKLLYTRGTHIVPQPPPGASWHWPIIERPNHGASLSTLRRALREGVFNLLPTL